VELRSFPEYLGALDGMPRDRRLRTCPRPCAYVMGNGCTTPPRKTISARCTILRQSLRRRAGFSTGRTAGHTDLREPVPGTYAADAEIARCSRMAEEQRVLSWCPRVVGHIGLDPAAMEPSSTGCSGTASVPATDDVPDPRARPRLRRVAAGSIGSGPTRGADIHPQVASRCFGMLFGHQSRLQPFRHRPGFLAIADLSFEERVRALRNPDLRARILAEDDVDGPFAPDRITDETFENLFPLGRDLDYEPPPDASVAAMARRAGVTPWALAYDLMLGDDGHDFLLRPLLNFGGGSYDGLHDMLMDPMTVQGLGDGGEFGMGAEIGISTDKIGARGPMGLEELTSYKWIGIGKGQVRT
jgi:hypothetical protein